jgi:Dolichyl-phosphate-mannose-protein mannosyltransferase
LDRGERRVTSAQYRGLPETITRFWRGWLFREPGLLIPAAYFAAVLLIARPLVNGTVADSWIYLLAIKRFNAAVLSLPGFTAAMPVAQIIYGALWSRLFGLNYVSLDYSVALLGVAGAMLFYLLARRCNAGPRAAALATALLIVNPCYLFLSFSFMTDVPFLTLLIAVHLTFAAAQESRGVVRLWICAALLVLAFMVRPFALAAAGGCAGAVLLPRPRGKRIAADVDRLLPFLAAAAASVAIWLWLTALMPVPWMLGFRENRLTYLYLVPVRVYFIDALVAPSLYMGLVLSPLALPHLLTVRWRQGLAAAGVLALVILPLLLADRGANSIPELSCCGGWDNVLVLRGPMRFIWTNLPLRLGVLTVSILGLAGMVLAAVEIKAPSPAFVAVILSAAIYWGGLAPLWLFNDRYYLVMLPAGCLLLALAPRPRTTAGGALACVMLAAMGWFAAAGVYDQQRGLEAVMAARDRLLHEGIPRSAIDAGYPLNGNDLYRDPKPGEPETFALEAGIPLITSSAPEPYTIAAAPMPASVIVSRFQWPGVLGFGRRTLYVLKQGKAAASAPRRTDRFAPPGFATILMRLAAMALIMLAPLLATVVCLVKPVRGHSKFKS